MLSTVEKVLFLKSVDLFSRIPGDELAEVALVASEEHCEPGDTVFSEGEEGDALFLVIEGSVRVHRDAQILAELAERECFGEMAILDAAPRSATVTARDRCRLLRLSRQDFQDLMGEKPELALGIIQVLSRRLRGAGP